MVLILVMLNIGNQRDGQRKRDLGNRSCIFGYEDGRRGKPFIRKITRLHLCSFWPTREILSVVQCVEDDYDKLIQICDALEQTTRFVINGG